MEQSSTTKLITTSLEELSPYINQTNKFKEKYQLGKTIRRGSCSTIKIAIHKRIGVVVAIKMIKIKGMN